MGTSRGAQRGRKGVSRQEGHRAQMPLQCRSSGDLLMPLQHCHHRGGGGRCQWARQHEGWVGQMLGEQAGQAL